MAVSMDEFLKQCEQSGDSAYAALRSLLERLEDPATRTQSRVFLSDLYKRVGDSDQCLNKYHFRIQDVVLEHEADQGRKKLTMMVIPSIFIPEDWSFTFYEGLNRHPDSIFKDRTVAELGCGNGWISIAIADKWLPSKVYGLDINPRAVKVSWINLYLNALDDKGQPIYDAEKKTLLDRVEFYESDLLSHCRDNDIQLERIVGCIPQILNPNPDAMSKMITENASEDFLYDLSNYCALQAADTDITALVEIEKNSPHRFEFFMGLTGDQPICARTAWAYGKAGGRIAHALSVYSCQLRQPQQVKKIFKFLRNGFQDVGSSLDLSFEDDAVADEKIPFLAYLAGELKENSSFSYEPPAGSLKFRNFIAGFMKTYHHIPLKSDNVVIFPSRSVAIEHVLRLFSPRLAVVDEHLTRHLPRQWLTSLVIEASEKNGSKDGITVIEAPRQSDLMVELITKLRPQVVITGIAQFEAVTSSAFVHLLDVTRQIGSRLFLDISDQFELSSLPNTNGVLKYLAGNVLPSHASIVCGLVKNKVYSDLEVAFVISEEEAIFKALSKTVEVLEGITTPIRQHYYGCLFHELLAFQLADRHPLPERDSGKAKSAEVIGFASSATSVLNNSELSIGEEEKSSALIHMDVDQSFLPTPSAVKASIFESFARQNVGEGEVDVNPSIKQFVQSSYGFPTGSSSEFVYSDSAQAIFTKLVLCCNQEGGTLCFPSGSNGNYISSAKFLKASIVTIPTDSEGFKLTDKQLNKVLDTVKKPWVYICGPTANPTGLIYSNKEMESILTTCAKFGARVIIDTSFSGLEFDGEAWGGWNLEATLSSLASSNPSFCVSLLGGMSLKMFTGALKFGFLILNHPALVDAFYSFPGLSKPHATMRYAVRKLLGLREQKVEELTNAVAANTKTLKSRAQRLKETLVKSGWDVVEPQGGISLVAKPSAYLNKVVKFSSTSEFKVDESNIREAIFRGTGLCINSASWTGLPGYCRFTTALSDDDFERAMDCIKRLKDALKG
ncbi:unnamed protein product [Linum tenue]|uniref:methionine S-methyltransferase n=1 Tax=Linum tenue TaxID=586396 RepID=A0AAV0LZ90_9ROSI|nr:unnamed protein product [Linum tenue]